MTSNERSNLMSIICAALEAARRITYGTEDLSQDLSGAIRYAVAYFGVESTAVQARLIEIEDVINKLPVLDSEAAIQREILEKQVAYWKARFFANVTLWPDELSKDEQGAVRDGNKITAIKMHRERTGSGLKDAKDRIEEYAAALKNQVP